MSISPLPSLCTRTRIYSDHPLLTIVSAVCGPGKKLGGIEENQVLFIRSPLSCVSLCHCGHARAASQGCRAGWARGRGFSECAEEALCVGVRGSWHRRAFTESAGPLQSRDSETWSSCPGFFSVPQEMELLTQPMINFGQCTLPILDILQTFICISILYTKFIYWFIRGLFFLVLLRYN